MSDAAPTDAKQCVDSFGNPNPVQTEAKVTREEVAAAVLYFRFEDRKTGEGQTGCSQVPKELPQCKKNGSETTHFVC